MSAHRVDTFDLRRHPLALNPGERAKLEEAGKIQFAAPVLRFTPMVGPGALRTAAEEYLAIAHPVRGTVRSMAAARGLNYHSLMTTIGNLRTARAAN
jgi:hypothetical protein